ncbi:TatD family hydrolase [Thiomicrospira cyclica]|uniref:TatD-related deoxyribonuclease n=1 Tax=Thiomicrospira cyclica (strain DSM 14477 / JCM 11371 / ALM1) TaxID=717773 RepID=F6D9G7_THICA|nr:TatD family hydrolase [Thiomicrospira cyclica]AEG30924.1 TatD-related deoxyribonuclease [Thiomicrospira cyclica ALM1]
MLLFDSHAHLDSQDYPYKPSLTDVVAVSVDLASSRSNVDIKSNYPSLTIHSFVGIHPWFISKGYQADLECLAEFVSYTGTKIAGIGEIGLDYYRNADNKLDQQTCLDFQLQLASLHRLPVSLHCVKAFNDLYNTLRGFDIKGVVHSMPLMPVEAKRFYQLGFLLGLNPRILQSSHDKRHAFYSQLPLTAWVIESDFPNLSSSNLCIDPVLGMIALIKDLAHAYGISDEAVAQQIYNTTKQFVTRNIDEFK